MMAWVCPAATVRLTPDKISWLSPDCAATLTCRSRISRVGIVSPSLTGRHADVDLIAIDPYGVSGQRLAGRRPRRLAGPQGKAGTVQPALHGVVIDLAVGERHVLVRAELSQRVDVAVAPDDHERSLIKLHRERAALRHVGQAAGPDESTGLAHRWPLSPGAVCARTRRPASIILSSSISMAALIRWRSSATSISSISSPKKPLMIRRRASSRGIPRAIR